MPTARHYRLTLADAIAAHDEALLYGGVDGITSLHLIESALARPNSGYHRPIYRKAAALLHSMVGNHGFADGNKRTSWLLVDLMIERSGFRLEIADDEPVDDLVVAVAAHDIEYDQLVAWFRARIVVQEF